MDGRSFQIDQCLLKFDKKVQTLMKCGKKFQKKNLLEIHQGACQRSTKPVRRFKYHCRICGVRSNDLDYWNDHKKRCTEASYQAKLDRRSHKCKKCGNRYPQKCELLNHAYSCTGKKHECRLCGRNFVLEGSLKTHLAIMHPSVYYDS